jgi:cytoskeleton protein RodZ
MDSAGALLKAERLKHNKTLKDIAERTRIGIFTLEALEADKTELLPPEAYVRGFIKAYADELDISPDEALALYDAQVHAMPAAEPFKDMQAAPRPLLIPGYAVPAIAGALVLLVCALFFGYMGRPSRLAGLNPDQEADAPVAAQTREQEPLAPEQDVENDVKPAAELAAASDNESTSAPGSPFTIRFAATERCWMRFTVDGKHIFEVTLKPGDTYSVNAVTDIKVRIGNPGGLTAFYNNNPVSVPGKRGRPVEMSFPIAARSQPASSP